MFVKSLHKIRQALAGVSEDVRMLLQLYQEGFQFPEDWGTCSNLKRNWTDTWLVKQARAYLLGEWCQDKKESTSLKVQQLLTRLQIASVIGWRWVKGRVNEVGRKEIDKAWPYCS